jgi:hypothetical protein
MNCISGFLIGKGKVAAAASAAKSQVLETPHVAGLVHGYDEG